MSHSPSGPRAVALVGPYGSGKSTLFDALLAASGSPLRRGAEKVAGELRLAHCSFMDEPWALIDCPGSVEFAYAAQSALAVADLAVLVCEPDPARAATAAPILRVLDGYGVPFLVFVNRVDQMAGRARDTVAALQPYTSRPLVLRQVPIREADAVVGYVDVVSERAYRYRRNAPSERVDLPEAMNAREHEARAGLIEVLADHDDALLEKVVEDVTPTADEIYDRLRADEAAGTVAGALLGAADRAWGVRRLWKALRHDAPDATETAARRGVEAEGGPLAQVFRTINGGHGGKVSWVRLWRGPLKDGATLNGVRLSGIWRLPGGEPAKIAEAESGELVALGRLEGVPTGAALGEVGDAMLPFPEVPRLALRDGDRHHRPQGRRAAGRGIAEAGRGGPVADRAHGPRNRRDGAVRPGRDAPAQRDRAAGQRRSACASPRRNRACRTRKPSASRSTSTGG